ncbi:hypothetical protein HDU82_009188 [Entophlyctis luteolus]|nr:hypothetical protein HDU82_009188 [Entophlyctis luteolus]
MKLPIVRILMVVLAAAVLLSFGSLHKKQLPLPLNRSSSASATSLRPHSAPLSSYELPSFKSFPVEEPVRDSTSKLKSSDLIQPICPKWEPFDKQIQMSKDFAGDCDMRQVESQDRNFKVTLCASRTLCGQGYFLVERVDKKTCDAAISSKVYSPNTAANDYFKNHLGPDAFHLIFDGPERAAPTMWHHLGNCVYKLPYRLVNTGHYSLHLVHTYEKFAAVDEANHVNYPTPVFSPLLNNFELSVCPHCVKFTSASVWKMHQDLPLCSRTAPQQGVFLRMAEEGQRTRREKYKFENYGHPYIWEPLGCRFDQLFELGDNSTCISQRDYTVAMQGDSHTRVLWFLTDLRLKGSKEPLEKNLKHHYIRSKYYDLNAMEPNVTNYIDLNEDGVYLGVEEDDSRLPMSGVDLEYCSRTHMNDWIESSKYVMQWDESTSETVGEREQDKNDAIVLSVGQWPASGIWAGGHYTLEHYEDMVEYGMHRLELSNHRRVSMKEKKPWDVIWFGVPGFMQYTDGANHYADWLDWRTNYRLKLYSDLANRVMLRYPHVKRMNTFDISFPWTQECPDGAHYLTTPALDAMVDEFLHKLNLCNV